MKYKMWLMLLVFSLFTSFTLAQDDSVTLRLAINDPQGRPSEPYVLEFIAQVNSLSNGSLTIEPYWDAGSEPAVIQLVMAGEVDLGQVASRAFNGEGVTSLDALYAPFLIDNDALAEAVATSDTAKQMLEGMSSAGIVGLTMWPEDMRHPFAINPHPPLLSPEDFVGINIRTLTSGIPAALVKALGGTPVFPDNYQGAESGLRQGGSLNGTQVATGNVTFFSKYPVLFANGAAFEKLNDEQKSILREAAKATQTKAIAEHPNDSDAATAYCAEGGTVVLASEAQIAAFEKAAQPVFDQIEQDPANAGYIAAIRALKASTTPSAGAQACEPPTIQASSTSSTEGWSEGLPPNGIWQVELNEEDLVAKGLPRGEAQAIAGVTNWEFQDGKFTQNMLINSPRAGTCTGTYAVVEDFVRFTYTSGCDGEVDDVQWRLDEDGLHLHLVAIQNAPFRVNKFYYEANPWKNIETWSEGLPPNGIWQVELTADDLATSEMPLRQDLGIDKKSDWEGIYTFTLQDGKVIWQKPGYIYCKGSYELAEGGVRFSYALDDCDRQVDDMQWRLDNDGLHLQLVGLKNYYSDTNSILFGTKPWQKMSEPTTDTTVWEKGLPPNGTWQVELSLEDFQRMGVVRPWAADWAGTYTFEFNDDKGALLFTGPSLGQPNSPNSPRCDMYYEAFKDDVSRFTYTTGSACLNIKEFHQWRLDDEGLHLHLVDITNAPFYENRAVYEAKPWQKIE
jgi:TRAP-type C4-dicarboxylate transport system substrate-binding protein